MTNTQEIFEIKLEDYSRPRYDSSVRNYYGTYEEISDLMTRISNIDGAKTRYQDTIEAVEYFGLDEEIPHLVAGQIFPILMPVHEVCRFNTTLLDQRWEYITHQGEKIPCYASRVDVLQALFSSENGYERCIRASFTGLSIFRHGVGWVNPCNVTAGFPGMATWDGDRNNISLLSSLMAYSPEDLQTAVNDTVDVSTISLTQAVADIIGEG